MAVLYCLNGVFGQLVQPDAYRVIVSYFAAYGAASDRFGTVYFSDMTNGRIVMVNATGAIINQSAAYAPTTIAVDADFAAIYYVSNNGSTQYLVRIYDGTAQYYGQTLTHSIKDIAVMHTTGYVIIAAENQVSIMDRYNNTLDDWTFSSCSFAKIAVNDNDLTLSIYIGCRDSNTIYKCSINGTCDVFIVYSNMIRTMAVDPVSGDVFVSGTTNGAISRYAASNGTLLLTIDTSVSYPFYVAMTIDYVGNIFIVPTSAFDFVILCYSIGGQSESTFTISSLSTLITTYFSVRSLALDPSGAFYVFDTNTIPRVLRFTDDLAFNRSINNIELGYDGGYMAMDNANNLYITDTSNKRVIRCSLDGSNIISVTNASFIPYTITAITSDFYYVIAFMNNSYRILNYSFNTQTYTDVTPYFEYPFNEGMFVIATDNAWNFYMASTNDDYVLRFRSDLQRITGHFQLRSPVLAITVDSLGYLYVSTQLEDDVSTSIVVFRDQLSRWTISPPPSFNVMIFSSIAVDLTRGVLYCGDSNIHRVFILPLPVPPPKPLSSSTTTPRPPSVSSHADVPAGGSTTGGTATGNLGITLWFAVITVGAILCCCGIVVAMIMAWRQRQRTQSRLNSNKISQGAVGMQVFMPPPPRLSHPNTMQEKLLSNTQ